MHLLILILITSYQVRVAGIFPAHYELVRLRDDDQVLFVCFPSVPEGVEHDILGLRRKLLAAGEKSADSRGLSFYLS
jgi:hypothetical protein